MRVSGWRPCVALALLALLACTGGSAGDPVHVAQRRLAERHASFDLRDVSLVAALEQLSEEASVVFEVDPGVQPRRIDLQLRQVPLEVALEAILAQTGLLARLDGDRVTLVPR